MRSPVREVVRSHPRGDDYYSSLVHSGWNAAARASNPSAPESACHAVLKVGCYECPATDCDRTYRSRECPSVLVRDSPSILSPMSTRSLFFTIALQIVTPKLKLLHQNFLIKPLDRMRQHAALILPSPDLALIVTQYDDLVEALSAQSSVSKSSFGFPGDAVDVA